MTRRVLVTGDRGLVGAPVAAALREAGWDTAGFDVHDGLDVRDAGALTAATAGCHTVVHLAALPSDDAAPEDVMGVNAVGTANVLLAGARGRVGRVVFMSSAQALGVFAGHRSPDYLPLDDEHPTYAAHPYALSKRVGEELCARFSAETGIPTLCLRPPLVLDSGRRDFLRARLDGLEHDDGRPFWEYGAFLDVQDLAGAVRAALEVELPAHRRLLLCAGDVCAGRADTSRELARRLAGDVPWRGGSEYERDPWRALIDCAPARELLGWMARKSWRA